MAHLGPSAAAGIGTLLGLPAETVYQAVGQALHTTTATRQSRKGEISTWKAHAPAFAGKMAVEAVDRALRGQTSPSPIYEGSDGVIAWLLDGPDARWLDLCAGPGGKAALLAALAGERGATLVANEVQPHRARLVERALRAVPDGVVERVRTGDGREVGTEEPAAYDRVLVDAPCTGLGALRRRPESRWRRTPADLGTLTVLQRELLSSALDAVRPGGVVAYVTCSPHLAETRLVVDDVLRRRDDAERIDARSAVRDALVPGADIDLGAPSGGAHGLDMQLWPHVHGTDAMHLTLLRRLR